MAEGTVMKHTARDGKITWWVRTEEKDSSGKRKRPRHVFDTKKEADSFIAERHTDIARGVAIDPSKMSTGDFLEHWLETCRRPSIRPSTYASYQSLIRVRIKPYIGAIGLQQLSALQVQGLYADLLSGRRVDGKKGRLSNRTVKYVHTVIKMALKQAARWRMVVRTVAEDVQPPKAVRPHVEYWNAEEAQQFLRAAESDSYGAIWLVALHTGMRKGELLKLRWGEVDLVEDVIRVRRGGSVDLPKSDKGWRSIKLDTRCTNTLREHRDARPLPLSPAAPVFTSGAGTCIDQRNLTRRFDALVAQAGIKRISFHGMRHTHATLLLLYGVDIKTVSARLGHASVQITLDTYAHVLPQMEQRAADAIEAALSARA
jgi:integrase